MRFTIPIYVESFKPPHERMTRHTVRPLFFDEPQFSNERLGKALERCVNELHKTLSLLGRAGKHDVAARYACHAEFEQHRLKLDLEFDGEVYHFPVAVFAFRAGGRKTAFFPARPEVWFELRRGDDLESRARDVVERLLRSADRRGEDAKEIVEDLTLHGKASIATVELSCDVSQNMDKPKKSLFALLGATEKLDGAQELERTGRCLDRLYPDRLGAALFRDREADDLFRIMNGHDRRPVLLVGPRRSGKTAVIHEVVRRIVEDRGSAFKQKRSTWLLSPQRLISGMSFVGQWESRLRAILAFATKHDHTLYFDDLVGTFRAGMSRDSDLNVAQLLKPCLEQRTTRILGEITPEALRVLRERDRTFADRFHVVRIDETNPSDTLRVLLSLIRRLERSHACEFALDVLPETIDLCRRFRADAAFPGKGADVLQRLAARHRGGTIEREHVLDDFQANSRLNRTFLDRRTTLPRENIETGLREMLVGQEAAVTALADVLCLAKAGIQDPRRPLASFLFLGPTGVGKTQCAKALARYLFDTADRLLRFDMNEFVSPLAVPRLVGTFDQPEGILTRAVARQPFSVLLLDEIEKAHPDVFDLLLQVLGEGRLTDALGRTVDFTHTVIILTSNLGSREATAGVGFSRTEDDRAAIFQKAVREFFRPEFVNRLDHIVPFARLTRDEVHRVSRIILRELAQRDGLLRRKCLLDVPDEILDRVVATGFNPVWGARGVRRAIEQQLVRPAATRLAATVPATPSVVSFRTTTGALTAHLDELNNVAARTECLAGWTPPGEDRLLDGIDRAAARLEALLAPHRLVGTIDVTHLTADQEASLTHLDALREVRKAVRHLRNRSNERDDLEERLVARGGRAFAGANVPPPRLGRRDESLLRLAPTRTMLAEITAALDVHAYITDLMGGFVSESLFDSPLSLDAAGLVRRMALLEATSPVAAAPSLDRLLLVLRSIPQEGTLHRRLAAMYAGSFAFTISQSPSYEGRRVEETLRNQIKLDVSLLIDQPLAEEPSKGLPQRPQLELRPETAARLRNATACGVLIQGEGAGVLAGPEAGIHLAFQSDGSTRLVVVEVIPLSNDDDPEAALVRTLDRANTNSNGVSLPGIVRIYDEKGTMIDLPTGTAAEAPNGIPKNVNDLALARLPVPVELREISPSGTSS